MSETTRGSSRRRRRAPRPQQARQASESNQASTPDAPSPDAPSPDRQPRADQAPSRRRPRDPEGGLRELIGGGKSQLGVEKALRGRDVNRPSDADLEAAEQDVVIVRRHWTPPTS